MSQSRFAGLSVGTRLYVTVVVVAGAATVLQSFYNLAAHPIGWDWAILAILTLLSGSATVRQDAAAVAWWVLVGAASGAIAGALVGGIGGRLAMLLLRLTSPDAVTGMISDDGFEIGVVSFETAQLVLAMAMLGGINGVFYAALRTAIPRKLRLPLWSVFAAALGGANIVHDDGVDFALLEPAALAIALFVLLPERQPRSWWCSWSAGYASSRGRTGASRSGSASAPSPGRSHSGSLHCWGLQRSSCAGDGSQVRSRGSRALPCRERSRS